MKAMGFFRKRFSLIFLLKNACFRFLFSISDPVICTRYYRCSHGTDETFECPRGTAWDDVTKSCAWVDEVNCGSKKLGYSTSTPSEGMKHIYFFYSNERNKRYFVLFILRMF